LTTAPSGQRSCYATVQRDYCTSSCVLHLLLLPRIHNHRYIDYYCKQVHVSQKMCKSAFLTKIFSLQNARFTKTTTCIKCLKSNDTRVMTLILLNKPVAVLFIYPHFCTGWVIPNCSDISASVPVCPKLERQFFPLVPNCSAPWTDVSHPKLVTC